MTLSNLARRKEGMTLIETLVSTAAMALIGCLIFYTFYNGMMLFAKNTSVNAAHQQARTAVLTMEQSLHSSVSIPQLVDTNKNAIAGSGPAAGISFQQLSMGPFKVIATAPSGQNQIHVNTTVTTYPAPSYSATTTTYVPIVGQRLCLPLHQIELDIAAVSGSGPDRVITLASNLTVPVETTLPDANNVNQTVVPTCFITDRYYFVVNNGQLLYYKPGNTSGRMLANNITSATPFGIPSSTAGTPYNRFVAAINLSTAESSTTNRGFKAANMFLNAMVPYRTKLCFYQ